MSKVALERLAKSKQLPIGHIERKKAKEAVKKIYQKCFDIERLWGKRIRRKVSLYSNSKDEMLSLCNNLCDIIGTPRIRGIILCSKDVRECSGGHFNLMKNEIHFPNNSCSLITVVHELTHHIERRDIHGDYFCWTLNYLLALTYKILTGKELHSDWED